MYKSQWCCAFLAVFSALVLWIVPSPVAGGDSTYILNYENRYYVRPPGSDCWGWTAPDGTEYALMGESTGIAIIRTTDYAEYPVRVGAIPFGTSALLTQWKDIKTYRHYAYAVSESGGPNAGLLILDLSTLPDSVRVVGSMPLNGDKMYVSHNLAIDTTAGILYAEGDWQQQIVALDLADPEAPQFIRAWNVSGDGLHDIYADNDTIYIAEGYNSRWSIWDWTNKSIGPQALVKVVASSAGYMHNIWPSPDRRFVVTTEETARKTIKIWDISDLDNVILASEFLGSSGLAHNAIWYNHLIVVSHYESGVLVVDATDPYHPVKAFEYDTYAAGNSPDYHGCWGVYPFTSNGQLYASNIESRLVVLQLESACPAPAAPAQLSPTNGATKLLTPIRFTWADRGYPAYRLQISTDSGFVSIVVDTVLFDTTWQTNELEYYTTHYWHLQSVNSCGGGAWSTIRTFARSCVVTLPGDINVDGSVTSSDVIGLVGFVFKSGPAPKPIVEAGDMDCSAAITATDIIRLVNFVFKGGSAPCDICSILL